METEPTLAARLIEAIEREAEKEGDCSELTMLLGMFGGALLAIPDDVVRTNLERVVKIAEELLG